jgi:hypothetical protein
MVVSAGPWARNVVDNANPISSTTIREVTTSDAIAKHLSFTANHLRMSFLSP